MCYGIDLSGDTANPKNPKSQFFICQPIVGPAKGLNNLVTPKPPMPTIGRFYGITIRMYFDEKHQPHFHAYYGGQSALVRIADGVFQEGELPTRAQR